jgi:hypothetical protein
MPRPASLLLPVLSLARTKSAPASEPLMDRLDPIRARHGVAAVALTLVDAEGTLYWQGEDGSDWRVGQCGSATATQAAVPGFRARRACCRL